MIVTIFILFLFHFFWKYELFIEITMISLISKKTMG